MATRRKTAAKRKPAAAKPARKRKTAAKPGAPKRDPLPTRPLDDDEIELSGVFGRVRFRESDPFAEVREIFNHYDRNKDGVIAVREFARVVEALGMELEEDELRMAFLDVDHDRDETIAWDEFVRWWSAMRG